MEKHIFQIQYQEYERFGAGSLCTVKGPATSAREVFIALFDQICAYCKSDWSFDQFREALEQANGDGCDYIFFIKDLNTNEFLFESDQHNEEEETDWDKLAEEADPPDDVDEED